MIFEIVSGGRRVAVDTAELSDWEYTALFREIWDEVCGRVARAAGEDLAELRARRARGREGGDGRED